MIIGAIGIGAMGTPMAKNLVADDDSVLVYDLDRAKAEAAAGNAITVADSVAAMAKECDLIVSMVSDDAALRDVIFGPTGLLSETGFTGCFADLSTTSLHLAQEVAAALSEADVSFIDGGVIGGGVPAATAGTSPIVLAGDEALVAKFMPVFERLGDCDYVGAQGNAKMVKIINNHLVGIITASNAEALSLGMEAGLPLDTMVESLGDGSGASVVLASYMGRYADEGEYGVGLIGHDLMAKDLTLACQAGDTTRSPVMFGELARQLYIAASRTQGPLAMFPSIFEHFRDGVAENDND
jgi:3-hydroxyisobutyrate dehydrogenase-like beta-hydroxyacid dehydrogenase